MTWSLVQSGHNIAGSGTSSAATFGATVTSGDIVSGFLFFSSTTNVISGVTDDKSNSYTVTVFQANTPGGFGAALFRSNSTITNAPQTITATASGSQSFFWILIDEFTPPNSTIGSDGTNSGSGNGGTISAGNITTAQNGDLIYVANVCAGGSTAGSGFTQAQTQGSQVITEYQSQTSAGSVTCAFTGGTGSWVAVAMAVSATSSFEPAWGANANVLVGGVAT